MDRGLVVTNLSSGYGDLQAVSDVSVSVAPGEVTCIFGRNGAGKTTTLHTIAGLVTAFGGEVFLDRVDIARWPTHLRARAGLGLVQEGKRILRSRTVEENLLIGAFAGSLRRRELQKEVDRTCEDFPILADRRRSIAGTLSGGQQQMLAIAQVLMGRPKVVMLDEPSAGLSPAIVMDVLEVVTRLKNSGIAVLLVEQVVEAALEVADTVVVIDRGRSVLSGNVESIGGASVLRDVYLGSASGERESGGRAN
jgi:branched-chain amino acid transport system ATP-binding protein